MQNDPVQPRLVDAGKVAADIGEGRVILIDIREKDERAREWIAGAISIPLSGWRRADLAPFRASRVVLHCRTGERTRANAALFEAAGFADIALLEGGIEGWRRAGMAVQKDRKAPLEIMRQVQIAAGGMALAGGLAGYLLDPVWALVAAFVGGGLLVAGTTGWCGMARMLRRMPWNRHAAA